MKKYLIISSVLIGMLVACTKDITRFNEETKNPAIVPAETLFSNGVRSLADALASANVNINVFRYTVQHWGSTTYQDEPNYDFGTRNIPQTWWLIMYRDVLTDLKESKRLISEITPGAISEATLKNRSAIIDMMEVYTYSNLVNTFGNVPYSESNDINNVFPKYDDAKIIYDDLLVRLDADIAAIDPSAEGFSNDADLLYGGDVSKWLKFGHSLKIRLAMTLADVDAAKAKSAFEAADAGAFTGSSDNAVFQYLATTPNTNPIWVDLVQSGRADMVAGAPLLNSLVTLGDPRLTQFFAPDNDGEWTGGIIGSNNTYAETARPSLKVTEPDFPVVLLDYSEIEFYRAEAKERGFTVSGTAQEHYYNAIRASIMDWGGTDVQATAYLAKPAVNYTTATGGWKQKIGFQKWIALYNRPATGWLEIRRLDFPVLQPPANPDSGFPNRFPYPANEQTLNPENYTAASQAIGSDEAETKLFWDIY
jgi:Starch-binding associating with outer membrane